MKKFFSKSSLLLLCFAASITACKQSRFTLKPAPFINSSDAVIGTDPISRLFSFSDLDLIYFLISKNGTSIYRPAQ